MSYEQYYAYNGDLNIEEPSLYEYVKEIDILNREIDNNGIATKAPLTDELPKCNIEGFSKKKKRHDYNLYTWIVIVIIIIVLLFFIFSSGMSPDCIHKAREQGYIGLSSSSEYEPNYVARFVRN